jgi:diguanylate cyclase (GGDEF)-like protein
MQTSRHPTWWPFLLLSALLPCAAFSACLDDPDPQLRQLQSLVNVDAAKALKQVQGRLDALDRAPSLHAQRDATRRASLYSIQASAYAILELSPQALVAVDKGLALAPDVHDPVHVALLAEHADNVFDAAGIGEELKTIEGARRSQTRGSPTEICLLISRGMLETIQDRADLAVVTLTQAYRATEAPTVTERHILAASALSLVMRGMGDYAQALALNREEIDWNSAHGATLSQSVAHFMRGQILKMTGDYAGAIGEFTQSRKLSVAIDDSQGIAFADLRICESHIELANLNTATAECNNALGLFSTFQSADTVKETRALLARIAIVDGRPADALATLNGVLDHDGADVPPRHVASYYEARASANAALHRYGAAYQDLREYARRYAAANDAERHQQAGALRARFETDRQIERNASLQRELTVSQQQSKRQAQQLRWNAVIVVVGSCVIALLIYFLSANFRYRQQLVKLASLDGLTGLPNRRCTAEFAAAALESARASGEALCIAIIDMDHFKSINDRCGHAVGDHVLKEFARTGGEALRRSDVLGRWGGEEFLLVMPGASQDVALANLDRLRTLVFGIRLPVSGLGLRVSLSAGLAVFDASVRSLDELIARADGALYVAKNEGRDLVRVADASTITGSHAIRRAQRL